MDQDAATETRIKEAYVTPTLGQHEWTIVTAGSLGINGLELFESLEGEE